MGSEEDVARWKAQMETGVATNMAAKSEPSLKDGLQKQYDLLSLWLSDRTQPVAQLVLPLRSRHIANFQCQLFDLLFAIG